MDKNNPYLRRVMNLYEAGMEKWRVNVVMNMVDMGGILDTLATFRGSENLLMDLSVNLSLEAALDLGWKILADCFQKDETGIKSDLADEFWPEK